jgi:hypothetical protein
MTFELETGGVRVSCSSPVWTQHLVEKGARLVDPSQAAYLPAPETTAGADASPRPDDSEDPRT